VMAYKLYDDASRCDELRQENKVVHPAFCPPTGRALST
jgi:prophage DNA circulation protein